MMTLDDTIKVDRPQIDARSEKSALSVVAFSAKQGDTLTVLERGTDGWWKVAPAAGGSPGYVRRILLDPTAMKLQSTGGDIQLLGSKDANASAAAKGIDPDVLKYAGAKNYDPAGVIRMLDLRDSITSADLTKFKTEGGLK